MWEEQREEQRETEHLLLTIRQNYDTFYQIWHDYFCALCNDFTAVHTLVKSEMFKCGYKCYVSLSFLFPISFIHLQSIWCAETLFNYSLIFISMPFLFISFWSLPLVFSYSVRISSSIRLLLPLSLFSWLPVNAVCANWYNRQIFDEFQFNDISFGCFFFCFCSCLIIKTQQFSDQRIDVSVHDRHVCRCLDFVNEDLI